MREWEKGRERYDWRKAPRRDRVLARLIFILLPPCVPAVALVDILMWLAGYPVGWLWIVTSAVIGLVGCFALALWQER